MAEKAECIGEEIKQGLKKHLESCAKSCKDVSSMFVYGTNNYGNNRCYDEGCECICEVAALPDGTCITKEHSGYQLFTYEKGGIISSQKIFHFLLYFC